MINELRVFAAAWLGWLSDIVAPTTPIRAPWPDDNQPVGEYPDIPHYRTNQPG